MDTIEREYQKAMVKLLISQEFYFSFAAGFKPVFEGHQVPTAAVDGVNIFINPDFFLSLSRQEQIFLLCHEAEHVMKLHHTRKGGRDHELWNQATDYAINDLLIQAGLTMPENGLHDTRYSGMHEEKIYNILLSQQQQGQGQGQQQNGKGQQQQGQGRPRIGDVLPYPGKTQAQKREHEQEIKERIVAAYESAKRSGSVPSHMERYVKELLNPKLPWREVLRQFVIQSKDDYSWKFPNRRFIQQGIYLPCIYSEDIGNFVIICDTSGSVSSKEMQDIASEVSDIAAMSKALTTVLYVDSELAGMQDFGPGEAIELKPKGGGGTDFRPGFEYIEEHGLDPACIVYFTDGHCHSFPDNPPGCPVIWVIKNNGSFTPPFGDKIDF